MKTKEELLKMSKEELIDELEKVRFKVEMYDFDFKTITRLKEILSAIGIVYGTYQREFEK